MGNKITSQMMKQVVSSIKKTLYLRVKHVSMLTVLRCIVSLHFHNFSELDRSKLNHKLGL